MIEWKQQRISSGDKSNTHSWLLWRRRSVLLFTNARSPSWFLPPISSCCGCCLVIRHLIRIAQHADCERHSTYDLRTSTLNGSLFDVQQRAPVSQLAAYFYRFLGRAVRHVVVVSFNAMTLTASLSAMRPVAMDDWLATTAASQAVDAELRPLTARWVTPSCCVYFNILYRGVAQPGARFCSLTT